MKFNRILFGHLLFGIGKQTVSAHEAESNRRLDTSKYDLVGDGDCQDFNGKTYNSVRVDGVTAENCAFACAGIELSYQVGFQTQETSNICDCLYSDGNVPSVTGLDGAFTGMEGKYAVLKASGETGKSCYKTKQINPQSVNSFQDYQGKSITPPDPISNLCAFNDNQDGFNCFVSYPQLAGSMLYGQIYQGSCTDNAAAIAIPVSMDGSPKAISNDILVLSKSITEFTLEEKNLGTVKSFSYCIRADVYDLMSQTPLFATKLDVSMTASFATTGTFQVLDLTVTDVEAGEQITSASRNVTMTASQGACGYTGEVVPLQPGDRLDVCIYLEGADDAVIEVLSADELLIIMENEEQVWALTDFPQGLPSVTEPVKQFEIGVILPSSVFDALASGAPAILAGTCKITYVNMRRDLLSAEEPDGRDLQLAGASSEEQTFSLEIVFMNRDSLPKVATFAGSGASRVYSAAKTAILGLGAGLLV